MTTPKIWNIPNAPVVGYAWEVEDPSGVILITHALSEYAQRYQSRHNGLIPALNRAGFTVYAYDLRGHGSSPGEVGMIDAFEQVEDHLAVRAAVRERHPDSPLYLFAQGAGALFTAGSVMADQSGVAGVIFSSPMLQAGQEQGALMRPLLSVASRLAPGLATLSIHTQALSRLPEELAAYEADPLVYHGKFKLITAKTVLQVTQDLWPAYSSWRVPTLVVYGSEDHLAHTGGLPEFIRRLASTDKTLRVFDGAYHELLNDSDRDEVLSVMVDWLEQRKLRAPEPEAASGDRLAAQRARLERIRQAQLERTS